ncbi:uncharacterized protein LOC131327573 [Rhododendron vialii]|uniref:uncharacterized protein LOC131327573 n=1 Tax=Rhododendron vialii TaxID=182163 RepID=UPI00265DFA12|nr:uncharacterized protein LOC131327573 [Rhododendron vialii]
MSNNDDAVGVLRTLRDARPAHFLLKIETFSILNEEKIEKYESDDFEVGGYKWGLCFYPNGNKKRNGDGHISLYLVIRDTDKLPIPIPIPIYPYTLVIMMLATGFVPRLRTGVIQALWC